MQQDKLFYVGQKAFIDKNGEVLIIGIPAKRFIWSVLDVSIFSAILK